MMSELPVALFRYKKILCFPYFLLFSVFYHDFIIYLDFTRAAASNAATDDVKN